MPNIDQYAPGQYAVQDKSGNWLSYGEDRAGAEQAYNNLMGYSNADSTGNDFSTGPGYGYLIAQMEAQNQALNQAYLRERMALIDVPMLEIEKDKLAWQKAQAEIQKTMQEGQLTGYYGGKPTFQRESFYANLLGSLSGPKDWVKYAAAQPRGGSFGAMQGGDSWEGDLWKMMQGTTPNFGEVRQPTSIRLSDYNQMSPTDRDMQTGLWSAQGLNPQDAWEMMRRAAPTGQAAQNTVWR